MWWMRYKCRHLAPETRRMLEQFRWRKSVLAFAAETGRHPDILVDFDVDEKSVVMDVGAYLGEWSERVLARAAARVLAFEPNPIVVDRLHQRLDNYPTAKVFEYGLASRDMNAVLRLAGPGSTVHATSYTHGKRTVQLREVVAVLDELAVDHIDVLKVNIEGGEYDLLEHLMLSHWLPKIENLLVQFHEWIPASHRRRRRIRRALVSSHHLVWDYPWVFELWRRERPA